MIALTVNDMEATLSFYRDLLGFQVREHTIFTENPAVLGLSDNSQYRPMIVSVPGPTPGIAFFEAKGVPRTPFRLRVPDPGCPAIQLLVSDLDGLLNRMKAAGVKIVSTGGVPAQLNPHIRGIFVEDPDGFKIELDQVSP
jgi:catechol 2,3-dioxygenase-like lactoylglutathione lyase family enzyme